MVEMCVLYPLFGCTWHSMDPSSNPNPEPPLHVHFELLCCTAADGRQWSGALKGISGGTGSICALESSIERIAHAPRDRKRDFIGAAHYVKCWQ